MTPEWKNKRSSLMREAERLDREDRQARRSEMTAEYPRREELVSVDGFLVKRWVASAMRGPQVRA